MEALNLDRPTRSRLDWRIVFWAIFVLMIVGDQAIKFWARTALDRNSLTVIANVFDLTLTYNKGIAFGMFQGLGQLLAPIAVAIAIGSIYYSMKHPEESPWVHIAMALLASGALGNLFDRLVLGQVTDMFHIRAFEFPIFNLADSCITVAASILIIRWGGEWFAEPKKKDRAHAVPPEAVLLDPENVAQVEAPGPGSQVPSPDADCPVHD